MNLLFKNIITESERLDYNLQYCTIQLIINYTIAITFKSYYNMDTIEIIFNDLVQEKIFLDPDQLNFFLKPLTKYNSRFISIKNM
jgi:hypothetical protein